MPRCEQDQSSSVMWAIIRENKLSKAQLNLCVEGEKFMGISTKTIFYLLLLQLSFRIRFLFYHFNDSFRVEVARTIEVKSCLVCLLCVIASIPLCSLLWSNSSLFIAFHRFTILLCWLKVSKVLSSHGQHRQEWGSMKQAHKKKLLLLPTKAISL